MKTNATAVKLPVKIGRHYVYLHVINRDNNDLMSFGPSPNSKSAMFPYSFINNQNFDHHTKRLLRKALSAAGRADLAAYSVPPKRVSQKKLDQLAADYRVERDGEINQHARGRYEQSETHSTATV